MTESNIDWQSIHVRLAKSAKALSENIDYDPEAKRKILEKRAHQLAQKTFENESGEHIEILKFSLGCETYGIETIYISEVCHLKDLTDIPCTPQFIAGVINLRGRVLTIVDLRRFFDLPTQGITELNRIIVITDGENEFGLLADSIEGLREINITSLTDRLSDITDTREKFLKGVTSEMLIILDCSSLFSSSEIQLKHQSIR